MITEVVNTLVLQSHTIQHTTGRFCHSRIVVTLTWFQCRPFHDDATNTIQRHKVSKLQSVAKRARSRHHRILQRQSAYINVQFCHNSRLILNTGPSLHTHRLPSVVFSTQHKQAPKPQAIRFSNEASHAIPFSLA